MNLELVFYSVLAVGIYHLLAHVVLALPRAVSLAAATLTLNARCGVRGWPVWCQAFGAAWKQMLRNAAPQRVVLVSRNFRGSLTWSGILPRRWEWSMDGNSELSITSFAPNVHGQNWVMSKDGRICIVERDKVTVEP